MPARNDGTERPLLALETSGQVVSAALWAASGRILERAAGSGSRHGVALAPLVEELLRTAGLAVRDLEAIAVSLGPGSWTGLRIGLAWGKAAAWGAGLALVGVPSFEALAEGACARRGPAAPAAPVLTVRHAYAEGLYAALFEETPEGPRRLMKEGVFRETALLEALAGAWGKAGETGLTLCGDGVCLAALAGTARARSWRVLEDSAEIPAGALAACAWRHLRAGRAWRNAAEIHAAAPLYLRASDPELKRLRKHPDGIPR